MEAAQNHCGLVFLARLGTARLKDEKEVLRTLAACNLQQIPPLRPIRRPSESFRLTSAQFLPQIGAHELAFREAIEVEFLIRRMSVVIRKRQTQ